MAIPEFTLRQLLEAGVHFGHQTHRWNPLMGEYIHSKKNGIHIIDLTQTVPMLDVALAAVAQTVSKGGNVLFVGTKRQAQKPVADAAERCAQYYINHRWLGGTLTNWETVSKSIKRLDLLDEELTEGAAGLTKKERLGMEREQAKLQASLGGIREMGGIPDILFVIDVKKESLAIAEAKKLGIPIVAVVDTNCSPEGVTYMIPGNDDASRAITLYCDLVARAALEGTATQMGAAGVDIGEFAEAVGEKPTDMEQPVAVAEDVDLDPQQAQASESVEANDQAPTESGKPDGNLETSAEEEGVSAAAASEEGESNQLPEETKADDTDTASGEESTAQESESKANGNEERKE